MDGHQEVRDKEETMKLINNHFKDESAHVNVLIK